MGRKAGRGGKGRGDEEWKSHERLRIRQESLSDEIAGRRAGSSGGRHAVLQVEQGAGSAVGVEQSAPERRREQRVGEDSQALWFGGLTGERPAPCCIER